MSAPTQAPLAVVTGANRGLGLGVARALSERSYRLFLTCRGQAASVDLARSLEAEVFVADVNNPKDVAAMAQRLEDAYGQVDVLVNNAAVAPDLNKRWSDVEGGVEGEIGLIRDTLETNVLGAYRVTRALMPLIRRSAAPRIVNVSSRKGCMGLMAADSTGYRASKAALNALTLILADELAGTPAKVNAVTPGWVRTDMGGSGADRSVEEAVGGIVWAATLPAGGPTGGFFADSEPIDW